MTELILNEVEGGVTLNGAIATTPAQGTVETWTVNTLSAKLQSGAFRLKKSGGASTDEIVLASPLTSTTISVTRGVDGTSTQTHANGEVLYPIGTEAGMLQWFIDVLGAQNAKGLLTLAKRASTPSTPSAGYGDFYEGSDKNPYFLNEDGTPFLLGAPSLVTARYKTSAAQVITTGAAAAIVNFDTLDWDTKSSVTTGVSWHFTAPYTGYYRVKAALQFATSTGWAATERGLLTLYKNGSSLVTMNRQDQYASGGSAEFMWLDGDATVLLNAGDTVDVRVQQNSGADLALQADATSNFIEIAQVGGTVLPIGDTQAIVARYNATGGVSIPNGTATIVNYDILTYDPTGAVTTGASWKFTAAVAGWYHVSASLEMASGGGWSAGESAYIRIHKNGVAQASVLDEYVVQATHTSAFCLSGSDTIYLTAGEYIDIRVTQGSGAAINTSSSFNSVNHISIEQVAGVRLPYLNPAFAAARYSTAAGQNIPNNTSSPYTIVDFGTLVYDTRSLVTTGASWKFTAPADGYYRVRALVTWASGSTFADGEEASIWLLKNGANNGSSTGALGINNLGGGTTHTMSVYGESTIYLLANEYVSVGAFQASGGAVSLQTSGLYNWVEIEQVSGVSLPQTLPQWVGAKYQASGSLAVLGAGVNQILNFDSSVFDTHAAVTTGSGWKFTAPVNGYYSLDCAVLLDTSTAWGFSESAILSYTRYNSAGVSQSGQTLDYNNNVQDASVGVRKKLQGSDIVYMNAGDYLQFNISQSSGSTINTFSSVNHNYVDIGLVSVSIPNQGIPLGAWTDWTPVVTQSNTPTQTVNNARYIQIGKIVFFQAKLTFGGAGGAATTMVLSLPITSKATGVDQSVGQFVYFDSGSAWYAGSAIIQSTTQARFMSTGQSNYFGVAPAITIASGDILSVSGCYEAA